MGLKHAYKSLKPDPADPTIIGATKWNADHFFVDASGAPIGNVGALLYSGAAGAVTHINSVAAGQVLASTGAGSVPAWTASPTLTSIVFAGGITIDGTELGFLDGVTPGTVVASKVVVVDANKDIATFRNLTALNLYATTITASGAITAGSIVLSGGGITIDGTELGYLDGVTPGTVTALKAVVVDANKDIASFRNLTASGIITTPILNGVANVLEQRNGVSPQAFRIYRTTDAGAVNFERLEIGPDLSGIGVGSFAIMARAGGTGAAQPIYFGTFGAMPIGFLTNGITRWRIDLNGHFYPNTDNTYDIGSTSFRPRIIYAGTSVTTPVLTLASGTTITSATDGVIRFRDVGGSGFIRLQFGGTTNAYPAWGRSGTSLEALLADGVGYTRVVADNYVAVSYVGVGSNTATAGAIRLANAGLINARNFANTTNRTLIYLNTSDQVVIGESAGAGSVVIPMTGPHGIGGGADPTIGLRISTTATGVFCCAMQLGGTLTATANGDTAAAFNLAGPSIVKGAFTALSAYGFRLFGSNMSASGTGTIATATTLFVGDAPTIGATNYSLWVNAGVSRFGGVVEHSNNITFTANATYAIGTTAAVASAIYTRIIQTDAGQNLYLAGAGGIYFRLNGVDQWAFNSVGTFYPVTDNAVQFGNTSNRITSIYLSTSVVIGTTPATTGAIRLPNANYIYGRNGANTADRLLVGVTALDEILIGSGSGLVVCGGSQGMNLGNVANYWQSITVGGANAATAGAVRLPNAVGIYARNAANTLDAALLKTDALNTTSIDGHLINVANAAIVSLGSAFANQCLLVLVDRANSRVALFAMTGGGAALVISDTNGFVSGVAGTPGKANVYYSGANSRYELENNLTTRNFVVVRIGSS